MINLFCGNDIVSTHVCINIKYTVLSDDKEVEDITENSLNHNDLVTMSCPIKWSREVQGTLFDDLLHSFTFESTHWGFIKKIILFASLSQIIMPDKVFFVFFSYTKTISAVSSLNNEYQ